MWTLREQLYGDARFAHAYASTNGHEASGQGSGKMNDRRIGYRPARTPKDHRIQGNIDFHIMANCGPPATSWGGPTIIAMESNWASAEFIHRGSVTSVSVANLSLSAQASRHLRFTLVFPRHVDMAIDDPSSAKHAFANAGESTECSQQCLRSVYPREP